MWPNQGLIDLLGIELPIIQAPMAGANGSAMAIAASEAGGLGSLPCAILNADKIRAEIGVIRQQTSKPINVNFLSHTPAAPDPERDAAWKEHLAEYYKEFGLDEDAPAPAPARATFDEAMCEIVEDLNPEVVSFQFGLPHETLVGRVKAAGCVVLSAATTVEEARWLEVRVATRSSPRAMRRVAIAPHSLTPMSRRKPEQWHWCRWSLTRWRSR